MSAAPEGVDAETGEMPVPPADFRLSWEPMTEAQAREITTTIKATAIHLCHLVRDAKTGIAWTPLGYDTWGEYVETEFGMSRQRAQQLIDHANKLDVTAEVVELATPPAEQIPERATRGLKTDDLRAALVAAMDESPAELTEAERLAVANQAIDKLRKAKAAASTAVDAVAPKNTNKQAGGDDGPDPVGDADPAGGGDGASGHDAGQDGPEPPAAVSDAAPSSASDAPRQDPAPAEVQPPHGGAQQPTDAPEAEPVPGEPSPTLPDDWRTRLANAAYLLGCPAPLLRDVIGDDDRYDLTALRDHLNDVLDTQEQNT